MKEKTPSFVFSLAVVAMIALVLGLGLLVGAPVSILLIINIALLILVSMAGGIPYSRMEDGMLQGIKRAISCVLILVFVGVTIGSWMQSGTVPLLIYYGLNILTVKTILPASFALCALLSVCIGTSWGTAGTMGVACVSIGVSLGIPIEMMVGAVISGAIFGDKLSPLSDTTILASSVSEVNIYRHMKSMLYTTGPTFLLSLVVFYFLGLPYADRPLDSTLIEQVQATLAAEFHFTPVLLLPLAIIVVMSVTKVPALLTLLLSGLVGGVFAYFVQGHSVPDILNVMNTGYTADTGVALVDTMLSKGGLQSMLSTVCIAILALALGGILTEGGYLNVIISKVTPRLRSDRAAILTTLGSSVTISMLVTNFYVSAVLIGGLFRDLYNRRGIDRSVLSRTIEDGTTIMLPLIPWNTSCIYYVGLFGVASAAFFPYAVFCWLNLITSVLCTSLGLFIFKVKEEAPVEAAEESDPQPA